MKKLFIGGGGRDVNLQWVKSAADSLDVPCEMIVVSPDPEPDLVWNLNSELPLFNGRDLNCDAAFLRYDVFSGLYGKSEFANENAMGWHTVFSSYCEIAKLFMFNMELESSSCGKLVMLKLAQEHGLNIPKTVVTNSKTHLDGLKNPASFITKPAAGGSYCISLDDALEQTVWEEGEEQEKVGACPAIMQEKLRYPEFRVYRIGESYFAYNINSETLDSRVDRQGSIIYLDIDTFPQDVLSNIKDLTTDIGCDFCAIDIKTDPDTKELVFLELNNGPMFMGYDKTSGGKMAAEMVRYLIKNA
jgi:glutathione synthase/RimK-type ligase-like ATP-grasp enzyme